MSDERPATWKLPDSVLRQGMQSADTVGAARMERAKMLAAGKLTDQNGIELAKFKSDAETGFVLCQIHGTSRAVGSDGVWRQTGMCENCYRTRYSPEEIARRKAEVGDTYEREQEEAVRRRLADEAAQRAALIAAVDADAQDGRPAPVVGPLAASPDPPLRLSDNPFDSWVERPARVEPPAPAERPVAGPESVRRDHSPLWVPGDRMDGPLPPGTSAAGNDGPREPGPETRAPEPHRLDWVFGRRRRRERTPR